MLPGSEEVGVLMAASVTQAAKPHLRRLAVHRVNFGMRLARCGCSVGLLFALSLETAEAKPTRG
jgi:hypothetical protein